MSDMRVYEAARKLNMQAGELVKLLEAKGIHTSPISTIEESLFNQLLEEMVAPAPKPDGAEPAAPLKLVSMKEKAEAKQEEPAGGEAEKPRTPLALAPEPEQKEEAAAPEPAKIEADKKTAPEPAPAAAIPSPAPEVKPSAAPVAPAMARAEGPGAWTFMLGLLAFILALGLGYSAWSINSHNARMESALSAMQNATDKMNLIEKTVELHGKQIANNEASIGDLAEKVGSSARMEAKSDLKASAAAMEELSDTLPAGQSDRVRDLARRMNEMSSGM